ncbi:MAG: GLPGLI family protein [Gelidibacter sp.]
MNYKFLFLLFFVCSSFAQDNIDKSTLVINYTHSIHIEGIPSRTTINSFLLANNSFSIYEMDFAGNDDFIDEEDNGQVTFLNVRSTKNPKIYKEINSKSIYSIERIFTTPFCVKDNFNVFNWKLSNEFKNILGYKCQKATINYRGRDYIAYFTTKIPFNNGPWKFSGLPGVILEIKSTDNVFIITAFKVKINNSKTKIDNPFETEIGKAISWDEFISKYKKKYIELLSYTDEDGGSMSIPKRKIEILIED